MRILLMFGLIVGLVGCGYDTSAAKTNKLREQLAAAEERIASLEARLEASKKEKSSQPLEDRLTAVEAARKSDRADLRRLATYVGESRRMVITLQQFAKMKMAMDMEEWAKPPAVARPTAAPTQPQSQVCSPCGGSGRTGHVCTSCGGSGRDGPLACHSCGGTGFLKCPVCMGSGR